MGGRVVPVVVSRWVWVWMVCEARRGYTQTGSVNGDIWVCVRLQFMQADSRRRMCSGHERVCVFAHAQLVARPTIACHQQDSPTRRLLAHRSQDIHHVLCPPQHMPLSSPKQHVKSNYCFTQSLVRDGSGIGPPRLAPLTPRAKWSEFDRDSLRNLILPRDTTAVLRVSGPWPIRDHPRYSNPRINAQSLKPTAADISLWPAGSLLPLLPFATIVSCFVTA
jgi:hypothetical protein